MDYLMPIIVLLTLPSDTLSQSLKDGFIFASEVQGIQGNDSSTGFTESTSPEGSIDENDDGSPSKVIGGTPVLKGIYPFQAGLYIPMQGSSSVMCGGSLITPSHILTAAHCFYKKKATAIRTRVYLNTVMSPTSTVQDPTAVVRGIKAIVIHPAYSSKTLENDIAILILAIPVVTIIPVLLAPPSSGDFVGSTATVLGWGKTRPNQQSTTTFLRKAKINIISNAKCKSMTNLNIPDSQICASFPGRDSCQGDSGGPLLVNRVQVGIVSYGIGCADPRYPGVYTRVSSYIPWIYSTILLGPVSNIFTPNASFAIRPPSGEEILSSSLSILQFLNSLVNTVINIAG